MDNQRETKPAAAPENKELPPLEAKPPLPEKPITKPKAEKPGHNGPPAPDFDKAAKILREEISTIATRSSKLNGDKSAAFKRVEDECHVNKAAAKDALKLANLTPELQSDYLRTLFGLMKPMGIGIRRDLVDLAEGVEGLTIPVLDVPASELEDEEVEGSTVASRAMRETAATDAKAKAAAKA